MFCNKCGAEIPERTKFCTQCGAKAEISKPAPTRPALPSSKTLGYVILGIAALFVLLIIGVIFQSTIGASLAHRSKLIKARGLAARGQYYDALGILMTMDPNASQSAEDNLVMGECYLGLEQFDEANHAFAQVMFRDSEKYKKQIGKIYVDAIRKMLSGNSTSEAWSYEWSYNLEKCIGSALVYCPQHRSEIAGMLLSSVSNYAEAGGELSDVEDFIRKAVELDPQLKSRAASMCAETSQRWSKATNYRQAYEWLALASELDSSYEKWASSYYKWLHRSRRYY